MSLNFDFPLDYDDRIERLDEAKDPCYEVAKVIAGDAKATAPELSGDYKDSIGAERTSRGARVIATDHKAGWIEFGAPGHQLPARWILRNAAAALGLKFKKGR